MNPEYFDELVPSEETEEVCYGFCIPLKAGGFAWLVDMGDDTYIKKSVDGHWYKLHMNCGMMKREKHYLEEIKSGKGNWIISPGQSSFGIDWNELEYEKASVVKRVAKVTSEYTYEEVK